VNRHQNLDVAIWNADPAGRVWEAQALRLGVGIRVSRMDPHQVTRERMRQRYGVLAVLSEFVVFAFRLPGRGVF